MRIFAVLIAFIVCGSAFAAHDDRPNIIVILTDDQGYGDISAHGNPVLKTPNLDRMRRESIRFTNFHVSPTCAPTRSALLTGRHEFRNGVTHTILERERLTLEAMTLPEVLKASGYKTGIFGKWHLGDEDAYHRIEEDLTKYLFMVEEGLVRRFRGRAAMPGKHLFFAQGLPQWAI